MKMKKVTALLLACCVLIGVAGCSKVRSVSLDEVADVCDELGFEEYEPEDAYDDDIDYDDGFYVVMDNDYIEDQLEDVEPYLRISGLDIGLDLDNIEEAVVFARLDSEEFEDVEDPEDLEDVEFNALAGIQITLDEYDQDVLYDIADGLDDLLRKANIDIDDLSSSEYKLNKDSLFLKMHIEVEALAEALLDSEFCEILLDTADDDETEEFLETLGNLTGDISVAVYVADGNILIVAGASLNCETDYLDEFCGKVHVGNPSDLPNCQVAIDGVIETLDDYADLMSGYLDAASYAGIDDFDF